MDIIITHKIKNMTKKIKKSDLAGVSLNEMLEKAYGKKGTKSRKDAEVKINKIAKGLSGSNKAKEKAETKPKKKIVKIANKQVKVRPANRKKKEVYEHPAHIKTQIGRKKFLVKMKKSINATVKKNPKFLLQD